MRRLAPPTPIPMRIPPLSWRRPFFVWTPVAIALAIGWPALMLQGQDGLFEASLVAGAVGLALTLMSLGGAWALGRPPRSRRSVIRHMLWCGGIAALATPFVLTSLLGSVAELERGAGAVNGLPGSTAYALQPLAMMIGLPVALFSGVVFSCVALVKQPGPQRELLLGKRMSEKLAIPERARDVQPFY